MSLEQFSLADKVCVVTGASRGIGRVIAIRAAQAGADLALVSRKQENLDRVAEEIRGLGRKALPVAADVSQSSEVEQMASTILEQFGRVDILVNNAGILPFLRPAEQIREDGWDRIMEVNLKGPFLCCQAIGRQMIKQKAGKIINISSMAGFAGDPGALPYAVSKAGLISLTKTLASEWGRYNIYVNAVAPGIVAAGMNEVILPNKAIVDKISRKVPLGRPGLAEEVADAVIFLASAASNYVNGTTLQLDGGASGYPEESLLDMISKPQCVL